jgi:hypothetical protein
MSKRNRLHIKENKKKRPDMIDFGIPISKYIGTYRKMDSVMWNIDTKVGFLNIMSSISPSTVDAFKVLEDWKIEIINYYMKKMEETKIKKYKIVYNIVDKLHGIENIKKTKILWKYIPADIRSSYEELASFQYDYFIKIMNTLLQHLKLSPDILSKIIDYHQSQR